MNSVFFELVNSTSVTVILTSFTCFLHGLLLWYSSQKDTIARLDLREISLCHRNIYKIEFDHYILFSYTMLIVSWVTFYVMD